MRKVSTSFHASLPHSRFVSSRNVPRRALRDETKTVARETNFLQMALENKSDGEHLLNEAEYMKD